MRVGKQDQPRLANAEKTALIAALRQNRCVAKATALQSEAMSPAVGNDRGRGRIFPFRG